MENPFQVLEKRLSSIENILLSMKNEPQHIGGQEDKEQLFSIQEAAKFLNLSVPTLYTKTSRNEIPFMKRGKRLYFSSVQLLEFIKEGKRKSNAEIEAEADEFLKGGRKNG